MYMIYDIYVHIFIIRVSYHTSRLRVRIMNIISYEELSYIMT